MFGGSNGFHRNGTPACLVDGSTRFIPDSTDLRILRTTLDSRRRRSHQRLVIGVPFLTARWWADSITRVSNALSKNMELLAVTLYSRDPSTGRLLLHAMPIMIVVLCCLAIAYRFYSKFLAAKVAALDDSRVTPAYRLNDGQNYHPTNRWVLFRAPLRGDLRG